MKWTPGLLVLIAIFFYCTVLKVKRCLKTKWQFSLKELNWLNCWFQNWAMFDSMRQNEWVFQWAGQTSLVKWEGAKRVTTKSGLVLLQLLPLHGRNKRGNNRKVTDLLSSSNFSRLKQRELTWVVFLVAATDRCWLKQPKKAFVLAQGFRGHNPWVLSPTKCICQWDHEASKQWGGRDNTSPNSHLCDSLPLGFQNPLQRLLSAEALKVKSVEDIASSNVTQLYHHAHSKWLVWEIWLFPISYFLRKSDSNLVLC